MPLEENKNPIGIEVLDNIIIRPADVAVEKQSHGDAEATAADAEATSDNHDDDIEREISAIVHHREVKLTSAETAEALKPLVDDVAESAEDALKMIALQQLEELVPTRRRKQAAASAVENGKQIDVGNDDKEQLASGKTPPRRILNKYALQPSPEKIDDNELLAILKGTDDCDDEGGRIEDEVVIEVEGEGHFEVLEVEENSSDSKVGTRSKEDDERIALEQMKIIDGKKRRRKQDVSNTLATDLVTSIASEWSEDEEKVATKPAAPPAPVVKIATPPIVAAEVSKKPAVEIKKDPVAPTAVAPTTDTGITPFKRTRIIKRKIIWDPDAPETQFSYASLVKSTKKEPVKKPAPVAKKEPVAAVAKKPEPVAKKPEPVAKKPESVTKKPEPLPKKKPEPEAIPVVKSAPAAAALKLTAPKRRAATPVNASKKKKVTEIDKLLGDEGAANMINSIDGDRHKLEKEQKVGTTTKREGSVTSPDKTTTTKKEAVSKKRTTKAKPSSSWDYVYNQQNVDSLIIRRRSNSSYSSTTSPRRLSVDLTPTNQNKVQKEIRSPTVPPSGKKVVVPAAAAAKGKGFEFAKPEAKSTKKGTKTDAFENISPVSDIKKSAAIVRKLQKSPISASKESASKLPEQPKTKDVEVKKFGNVTQIVLDTSYAKIKNTFTAQLMNKFTEQLDTLKKDDSCRVVVVTSAGLQLCQGIDFSDLVDVVGEKRKELANSLAKSVRNFLFALATFPKPIVLGVIGHISGIGVTMLPLFDVTIASDKSSYDAQYVKIGQLPEGFCLFSSSTDIRQNYKTKLLWLAEKLLASESVLSGLITKVLSPGKVAEEALNCGRKMAGFSSEAYISMKSRQIADMKSTLLKLDDEQKTHAQYWASNEFIVKLKTFIATESW